jgi:hypothetical protein
MTPQEKAKELIERVKKATTYKYQEYAGANYSTFEHDIEELQKVALIVVDEVLKLYWTDVNGLVFWKEVKQEIEKL